MTRPMFPHTSQYTVDERGCWNWKAYKNPAGYGQVRVDWKLWLTHRLAWACHKGSIPDTLLVLHTCDNPACCNPEHLFLGTHLDNVADKELKGRGNKGEVNPSAKLTLQDVRYIKQELAKRRSQSALAREFSVNRSCICKIASGALWKDVK